ncbi:MAG TPA: hypothetical protein VHM19_19690 [Polyangiales bacterium]|jgi:Flp pilus assembly protein TadD|nr:hypothetical protein [Polyangiales bacterium]
MFSSLFQSRSKRTSQPAAGSSDVTRPLRDRLTRALAAKQYEEAVTVVQRLEALEPKSPRWPHKRGDILQQLKRNDAAFLAYATAVRLYNDSGYAERASAMAKIALGVSPNAYKLLGQVEGITKSLFLAVDSSLPLTMEPSAVTF